MEIKITANIEFDYEKSKFYLAEFDVVKTDDPTTSRNARYSRRGPVCEQVSKRGISEYREAK